MNQDRRLFIVFAVAAAMLAAVFAWPRGTAGTGPRPPASINQQLAPPAGSAASAWDRLAQTDFAAAIRESEVAFPALESLHLIGVALFFGSILMLDLRLLGVAAALPVQPMSRLFLPLTWTGFALQVGSGVPLFIAYADQYSRTISFPLKIALIGLGGINMLVFQRAERRRRANRLGRGIHTPVAATLSIGVWLAAIVAGRWAGYERQPVINIAGPAPALAAPAVGTQRQSVVLSSRELQPNAFAISVDEGSPAEDFMRLVNDACGSREVCSVDIWEVVGQQATRRFSYSRNARAAGEATAWDCQRYPSRRGGECL
ncbi:MAG: hypothetical protein U1E56_04885 [Bauldia sp.]